MSHFMCYDIRLREIASGTEASLKFTKKTEVDVNALILRAIERTGRATGEPASGLNHIREEYQLRLLVFAAHLLKDCVPRVFGIGENDPDEFRCLIARR